MGDAVFWGTGLGQRSRGSQCSADTGCSPWETGDGHGSKWHSHRDGSIRCLLLLRRAMRIPAVLTGRPRMLLEGPVIEETWPWARLLLGPFLGVPAQSSRWFPPHLRGGTPCVRMFHGTRAPRFKLRVQRRQGPRVPNASAHGVEGAAHVLEPFKLRGMGLSASPPSLHGGAASIQPPPCIPATAQSPWEREECAMAVGAVHGVPGTAGSAPPSPPQPHFPKAFPFQCFYFFLLVTQHDALVPQFPLAVLGAVSRQPELSRASAALPSSPRGRGGTGGTGGSGSTAPHRRDGGRGR